VSIRWARHIVQNYATWNPFDTHGVKSRSETTPERRGNLDNGGTVNRKVCLVALSLLLFVSCARQDKEAKRSSEDSSQKNPRNYQQSCKAIVPPVEEVVFIDADTVLVFPGYLAGIADEEAVNRDRVPLITRDGGDSWNKLALQPLEFESVCFADVSLGWLVKQGSELWKTTDGGFSWMFVSKIGDDKEPLDYSQQAKFIGELNGWILSLNSLWHTEDVKDLFFANEQTGWLADTRGVYRTDDGGISWTRQRLPRRRVNIDSLCLVNEQEGWAASCRVLNARENEFDAILLHTTNGGGTWQQVDIGVKQTSFDKVYFGDAQNGWLVAKEFGEGEDPFIQNANIYRTRDGGITWSKVLSVKSPYLPG